MENIRLRFCRCTALLMGVATVLSSTLDGVLTEMASEWRNEAQSCSEMTTESTCTRECEHA